MTPRRRTRSLRSFAEAGLLFTVVCSLGCQEFSRQFVRDVFDFGDYDYVNDYRRTEVPETRRWVLQYTEQVHLTSEYPGLRAVVNTKDMGICPVTLKLSSQPIDIEETGFYSANDIYELKYRENEDGSRGRCVSEKYLRTERAPGPTRWAGHRTVTANLPLLTITWMHEDQVLGTTQIPALRDSFTLKTAPDDIDPVLLTALRGLEWNRPVTDPTVPTQAHGHRHLHWPPPPLPVPAPAPEETETEADLAPAESESPLTPTSIPPTF